MNVRSCLMYFAKIIGEEKKHNAIKLAKQVSDEFEDLVQIMIIAGKHMFNKRVNIDYVKKKNIIAKNKIIQCGDINDEYFYILGLFKSGISVKYKFIKQHKGQQVISVPEDGEYEVKYSSFPNFNNLDEVIDVRYGPYMEALFLSAISLWFLMKDQFSIYKKYHQEFVEEINKIEGEKYERVGNKSQRK